MITTARPLKAMDILKNQKSDKEKSIWCQDGQDEILTHKSVNSLALIMKWFMENNRRKPVVFVPKFYCYSTLYKIIELADFEYYDINEDFLPDYKQCSNLNQNKTVDIFIFVHYFGKNLNPNQAIDFCKNNQALLIEDAVHVMIGEGKTGKYGDFTLYSPWKNCGYPDGAVLIINDKGPNNLDTYEVKEKFNNINKLYEEYPKSLISKWKVKKLIQKFLPNRVSAYRETEKNVFETEKYYQISSYSRNKILGLKQEEVFNIGDYKRINAMVLEDCLKNKYCFETINKDGIPYALSIKINENFKNIWDDVASIGEIAYTWPDLNPKFDKNDNVLKQKKNLLHIAVHDGLSPQYINKKFYFKTENHENKNIVISRISVEEYRELCEKAIKPLSILQGEYFANAKSETQGWEVEYWKVNKENDKVAFFLTLNKYGFVYRINRGPYFVDDRCKQDVYMAIRKRFGKQGHILFFAPEEQQSGANINMMLNQGYRYRNSYFSTGFIDLREDEDIIRRNMDSKWRKHLKNCEKLELPIYKADSEVIFMQLLALHKNDKCNREYHDSGDDITKHLYDNGHIIAFYVKGESGEIISFRMVAIHFKTAMSYISWCNSEGYKKNVNRYVEWESIKYLKANGYEWFDLGGIDMVHTRSIAEFKLGTGCKYVNLLGEYLSF